MRIPSTLNRRAAWWWSAPALTLTLVVAACGLSEVTIPGLEGPSELALSLRLTADPDVVTADGVSQSRIEAILRNENGQRTQGYSILFQLADEDGNDADIGMLYDLWGERIHAATAQAVTDAEGVARVVYESPYRTDATANQTLLIKARPVGLDANAALYRTVRIELKSAEPRLFPQVPGNATPTCDFLVQAPGNRAECSAPKTCRVLVGTDILFQSTSSDTDGTIVRYQWYWGDGTASDDAPDTSHVYNLAASYTVTHIVTDDDGAAASCDATITAVNSL